MEQHAGRRDALPEFFERVERAARRAGRPRRPVRVPRPVHPRDRALARRHRPRAGRRSPATARSRDDRARPRRSYFPPGADVFVAHPPTSLEGLRRRARPLPVHAPAGSTTPSASSCWSGRWRTSRSDVELRIAGTGPERGAAARAGRRRSADRVLRARAERRELAELYAGARAVAFVPYEEDYGLVTLEAMLAGKPVITCTDSGGTDGAGPRRRDGLHRRAAARRRWRAAIDELWADRRERAADGPRGARARAPRDLGRRSCRSSRRAP